MSELMAEVWIEVGEIEEIPKLGARVVWRGGEPIAVFRTADDRIFALKDRCPHKGGPLSQGIVHGEHVTCPLHGWTIALSDGNAVAPDAGCAPPVAVRIEDGRIQLRLPATR
jgi:nitrite reductase (NADH) small subunit